MKYTVFADTRKLSRDQWLELRKTGIGGSDAGAIMGVHPYRGAFAVWADKHGHSAGGEENEAMRQGRDFEDYVAKRFEQATGKKVRREYGMLRSDEHPCMIADLDRRVIGEKAGLECKTSKDIFKRRYTAEDYPIEYYCQCLHYLAVTDFDKWYLAVLIYGTELLVYEINRADVEDDIEALIKAEETFWQDSVQGDVVPPPDALPSTTHAIDRVWPENSAEAFAADRDMDDLINTLLAKRKERTTVQKEITGLENKIKAKMGNAEWCYGTEATVRWRNCTRKRLNHDKLKAAFPGVDMDKISDISDDRMFIVKEANKKWED